MRHFDGRLGGPPLPDAPLGGAEAGTEWLRHSGTAGTTVLKAGLHPNAGWRLPRAIQTPALPKTLT